MSDNQWDIISVTSGKGGVGKTFITLNLAAALVKSGRKVLVLDCDLGLANIDIMLGITPEKNLKDVILGDLDLGDVIVNTKGGFDLVPASSGVREMAQLMFEHIETMKEMILNIRGYDLIILDTGAGISDMVLQFNLLSQRSMIVVNREPTSLTDAYAMIKVMSRDYEKQHFGVVVNSAANAKEGEATHNHLASICKRFLGLSPTYLGCILQDDAVPRSIMKQEIAFLSPERLPLQANIAAIAKTVTEWKT